MKNYSVLTFNVGGYEVLHEVQEPSENAEYIYVTTDRTITSSTWTVVYVDNPHPEDNFDLCFDIRYNPFRYCHTDTVIKIDGSIQINGSLDYLIDFFNDGGYDIALCIHPTRSTLLQEYKAWVNQRGYPVEQANKVLNFLVGMEGYDVQNYKGLYQYNFMIQRNDKLNNRLNEMTLAYCRYLAPEDKFIDRLDQTIGSFIINKYFNKMKVLPVSQDMFIQSKYFTWMAHGTNNPLIGGTANCEQPYLFNQPVDCVYLGY